MTTPIRLPRPALNRSASPTTRLHPYVALVVKYWAFVVGATIIGALVGYGLSHLVTPTYEARSTLYFSIGYGASGSDLNQGATYAQGQMLSFAELARSERVLQPVVDELDLSRSATQLANQIEVTTPANTVVLNITASSTDPEAAASISNSVAQSLTKAVQDVAPRDADGKATVSVRTVQSADTPTVPVAPNTRVNIVAAALIGLVLSLLAIAALRLLDTRLRGKDGVASAGGLPVLGRLRDTAALAFTAEPASAAAEDYRRLVATLDAIEVARPTRTATAKRGHVFVFATVTDGGSPEESGSHTQAVVASLALAAREAGHSVAVVTDDASPLAAAGNDVGGAASTGTGTGTGTGDAITVRGLPSRGGLPAALVSSHELVLVAAPGAADGSRALRLGQIADGVILLAQEGTVHIGELRATIDVLHTAGARVAGTVLTSRTERSLFAALGQRVAARTPAAPTASAPVEPATARATNPGPVADEALPTRAKAKKSGSPALG